MSTFFLDLEKRAGICYSIKSTVTSDEKAVFFFWHIFAYKEIKRDGLFVGRRELNPLR
jgi:hypothetical protein